MAAHPTPRVVLSRCLGFDHCRYNGNIISEPVVEHMKPFFEVETVCPEVAIGLGVPRHPIRLIEGREGPRLVQPETGRDVTVEMETFTSQFLADAEEPDGFILKFSSPSCGPRDAKLYVNEKKGAAFTKAAGLFGGAAAARFPSAAIEDEGRLRNFDIRQHFLTRLFTQARFRRIRDTTAIRDLTDFHAGHKLLLMAYNQVRMRAMGRLLANEAKRTTCELTDQYERELTEALARAPRRTSAINVLMHALGYVTDRLTADERHFFLDSLEQYRNHHVPLSVPLMLMRSWILRFGVDYLADQVFFEPYPPELVEVLDSGKGRVL